MRVFLKSIDEPAGLSNQDRLGLKVQTEVHGVVHFTVHRGSECSAAEGVNQVASHTTFAYHHTMYTSAKGTKIYTLIYQYDTSKCDKH